MKKHPVSFIFLFLLSTLLPAQVATAAGNTTSSVTVTIDSGRFDILSTDDGHDIRMETFGRHLVPGYPNLPAKVVSIAIPPGTRVTGIRCESEGAVTLAGTYDIGPVQLPRVIGEENPEVRAREKARMDDNYEQVYGHKAMYPANVAEFVGQGGFRKYNLANVRVYPFTYDTGNGTLTHHSSINITVNCEEPESIPQDVVLVDGLEDTEKMAERMIVNYDDAQAWYPPAPTRGLHDYVIITLESLTDDVQALADWESSKGRTVNVVTVEWIGDNYTGYDLAEIIRNFLREKYPSGEWGIQDVCLVGHYDDVPMRRTWQDVGYGKPETDYYYAELSLPDSESWDSDGDHLYGETGDPIDFTAEVNVGRIPWSDPTTVQHICDKSVAYENNGDPSFKKNILLLGAFFWADTDNAVLMEYKTDVNLHPWMADWTMTKMYEEGYSSYPCDMNLTNANVRSDWSSGTYSFVNWAGHGSPTSAHIMYNGSPYFISSSDCSILNDDYPAIIFADACSNSDTDYLNIGQAMLQQGGVGFLGATKVAYGMGAWDDPMDGSSQSMDYFFTTCCTSGEYTQGQAHQWALYQMYTYGLWYYTMYEMFEWGALWGNPNLSMGTLPVLSLLFPDGLPGDTRPPGIGTEVSIEIHDGQETYVPGTGTLHYRFSPDDTYTDVDLTHQGDDLYTATIPATLPGDQPQFYFSAEGDGGTVVTSPVGAPGSVYSFQVCLTEDLFSDNFETDKGWTVESFDLEDGEWDRGVPAGGGERGDPPVDSDGSGSCYLTDNTYGNSDVDGGPTHLMSPAIDLSSGDADISYDRWHYNDDNDDYFTVAVSNDNGSSWTTVEQVMHTPGWNRAGFTVSDFVTPTGQVKVRFSAIDNPNDSVTEAGIDAFAVNRIYDDPGIWADSYAFSASGAAVIHFSLDAGPDYAGRRYIVGGGISGSRPGTTLPGGNVIPINRDALTEIILNNLNGAVFQNFMGYLDGEGRATATLSIPGPIDPMYAGDTITFAFTLLGGFDFVSNPVFISIEP